MLNALFLFLVLICSICQAANVAELGCTEHTGAKLVSLQGTLSFDTGHTGHWQTAELNQIFCEGSRLRVGAYSRASITLPNDITLRLDADTFLALNGINGDKPTLLDLLKGFVHFISRTPKQLSITTPIANAGPEGTEFALTVNDSNTTLWVYEGAVRLFNQQGSLRLKPGESAIAELGQAPKNKIDLKPTDAVNWAMYYPPLLPRLTDESTFDLDLQQAINAYHKGNIDQALLALDKISPERQSQLFFSIRATIRLVAGRVTLAKQDIQQLLQLNPEQPNALALLAILAITNNDKAEALNLAKRAISFAPDSSVAYSALSYAEQANFSQENALHAAEQAVKLSSKDALLWARKAELELDNVLPSNSEASAKQALQLDENLERTQTVMGFVHLNRLEITQAIARFEKAVSLDSTAPLPRIGLGLAKIRNGYLERGRQDLEIAAILDPNNSLIRSYLAKAYYEEKRDVLAEDEFELAKKYDPSDPTPYFYDAIRKQTINRPVEALDDMLKAIELNYNKAVYRSKFLLDKDVASREASLGRIYNSLNFLTVANRQAVKSLYNDPSNYSAHRLLSDSDAGEPRQDYARASEYLQSQLLQPINYNPIQPSLAYTDLNMIRAVGPVDTTFNEYNPLFERDGVRLTSTGMGGTNNTYSDETALSGVKNNFSYSVGQLHYSTDGFRTNKGLKNNLYNAFAQYQISPTFSIQTEYRYRDTTHGDINLHGDPNLLDNTLTDKIYQNTYRVGAKISPNQNSDLLLSYIHINRNEFNSDYGYNTALKSVGSDVESQYIFHNDTINTLLGGGAYTTNNYQNQQQVGQSSCGYCVSGNYNIQQYFGYFYGNLKLIEPLKLTTGVSFDHFNTTQLGNQHVLNQISPKLGLMWQATEAITFRAASFKTVKSAVNDNQTLQPVQVAGFNQSFDDFNGTVAYLNGFGMDTHFLQNVYAGIEAYKRNLNLQLDNNDLARTREELYRFYMNWTPHNQWAINSQFRFENFRTDNYYYFYPQYVATASLPTEIRYFSPSGFFSTLKGTYVNQDNHNFDTTTNFHSAFFLVDTAIGYRFAKQYGLISLEAKNLFDTHFYYQDRQYQMNEYHVPDFLPTRMVFARLTLNF